jgi:TolA-binding protein
MGRNIIIGLLLLLLLAACGGSAGTASTGSAPAGQESAESASGGSAPQPAAAGGTTGSDAGGDASNDKQLAAAQNTQAQFNRLVIRTANLAIMVENVDSAEAQIRQIAQSRNGYILGSEVNGNDEQRRAEISFKVPATRFDEAIAEITGLALEVETQHVEGQDVTDEYVDLESRLRNLRAVEARLIDFLQQAQKVEEALQVNQQLTEIQGQIEQTEGRITYLKESSSYSTINVSLRGKPVIVVGTDKAWSPGTTARAAANSLIAFAQVIADVLIVFVVWFPIWLPALFVGLWLWRRSRRVPTPTAQP